MRRSIVAGVVLLGIVPLSTATAQLATRTGEPPAQNTIVAPHRTRLILKDGTYQVVLSYKIVGSRVQYVSAERQGQTEEIPLDLVDLDATKKWEQAHAAPTLDANGQIQRSAPVLDPELAKEEADRLALSPEVAPNLRLVPEDSVLVLDTWRGAPELIPLSQSDGDLNRQTGHSVLRAIVNPYAATHRILEIQGEKSPVQLHVADPAFYIRMDDDAAPTGEVMTVDTYGASTSQGVKEAHKQKGPSRYAIVRVDVRQGVRVVESFNISNDWITKKEEDVVDTKATLLPGGHWLKLEPKQRLLFGEYCVIEILDDHQINLGVWDFGVHPTEPENRDAIYPREKRNGLEHREPDPNN
jgi:hypothetical protein